MKRHRRITLHPEVSLGEALADLEKQGASSAPVVRDGEVIGHLALYGRGRESRVASGEAVPGDLDAELRLAKKIQQQMLPRVAPNIPGLQVYGTLRSATDVGGDYWSVKYYKADNRATMKLADVTGHGIAAALLVPAVKFVSGGFYRGAESPEWVMERTNHVLVKETPVEILVSMVYAWYKTDQRMLSVVNAGHSPVILVHNAEIIDIPPTGPVLGLVEVDYECVDFKLVPGDLFFSCSDGVTESRIGDHRFGEDSVKEIVLSHRKRPLAEIAAAVLTASSEPGSFRADDRSILLARASDTA
ncbi:MAG TPA: SpoIIE family protein phosphatase [Armatimonadota bacterium]|nr:SpoIIE family protein phosphatase [Armatimonadota bacterium]